MSLAYVVHQLTDSVCQTPYEMIQTVAEYRLYEISSSPRAMQAADYREPGEGSPSSPEPMLSLFGYLELRPSINQEAPQNMKEDKTIALSEELLVTIACQISTSSIARTWVA